MAVRTKSAKKRHRQSLKRRSRNRFVKSTLRTMIKKFYAALNEKSVDRCEELFRKVESALHSAASKGIIHKKTASRRTSRLHKKLHALISGSANS